MKKILFSSILFFPLLLLGQQPTVEILTSGHKSSLRGLSVVNDNVVWVSGSNGTVGRSNNAGKNWNWFTVKGHEKAEFRDIEAFDAQTALIMSIAEPAYILKTTDGGVSWTEVYKNITKGMFLDAMDFWNDEEGMVIGDPIDGRVFIATTVDGGDSWKEMETDKRPRTDSGEAFFAASGTNLRYFKKRKFFMISGGTRSRLFTPEGTLPTPLVQGRETTGGNSIAVYDDGSMHGSKRMIITGGDFNADSSTSGNCAYSLDGGKKWRIPESPPHGYRSCVEYLSRNDIISCGLNGIDYSANSGRDWQWISKESFHVCRIAKSGRAIFLAGNNGKIGRIHWR